MLVSTILYYVLFTATYAVRVFFNAGIMKGYETHYPNPNPCSKPTTRIFWGDQMLHTITLI